MLSAKLLIPAVAVGMLALVGLSSPAKAAPGAAPAKPGADRVPPPALLEKINAAFLAADPGMCRKVADEAEAAGFKAQADDLRAFAARVEAAIKAVPVPPKPPSEPTIPPGLVAQPMPPVTPAAAAAQPGPALAAPGLVTTLPEVVITAEPQPQNQAAKLLAGRTAIMLKQSAKGNEDKGLVTAFQQQELDLGHGPGGPFGTVPSKADGLFGPKTALSLARFYGIVPPKPLYWSKANWLTDKKNYRTEMARFAAVDPPRADEWLTAGKVL